MKIELRNKIKPINIMQLEPEEITEQDSEVWIDDVRAEPEIEKFWIAVMDRAMNNYLDEVEEAMKNDARNGN